MKPDRAIEIETEVTGSNSNVEIINNVISNSKMHISEGVSIVKELDLNSVENIEAFDVVSKKVDEFAKDVKNK